MKTRIWIILLLLLALPAHASAINWWDLKREPEATPKPTAEPGWVNGNRGAAEIEILYAGSDETQPFLGYLEWKDEKYQEYDDYPLLYEISYKLLGSEKDKIRMTTRGDITRKENGVLCTSVYGAPGYLYDVTITAVNDGRKANTELVIPRCFDFADFKVKMKAKYFQGKLEISASNLSRSSDMHDSYSIQIAISGPKDFVGLIYYGGIWRKKEGSKWSGAFDFIYPKSDDECDVTDLTFVEYCYDNIEEYYRLPEGTYTATMYLNGRKAAQDPFTVP